MATRSVQLPAIPNITGVDNRLAGILTPIKTIIDTREGKTGNARERFVTVGDLADSGITIGVQGGGIVSSAPPSSSQTGDTIPPDAPTNMAVSAVGMSSHRIAWKNPSDIDLYYIEIYRGIVNDFTDDDTNLVAIATISKDKIGKSDYRDLSGFEMNTTYYYWLVAVDWSGNKSDVAYVGQALYTDNPSINDILAQLQGKIDYSEISATLQAAADVSANISSGAVLATNVNGHVNGIVYANTGDDESYIGFVTDNFWIIDPGDEENYSVPFAVGTVAGVGSVVGIDGALVVDGSISAYAIETGAITAPKIDGAGFGNLTITSGTLTIQTTNGLTIGNGGDLVIASGGDLIIQSGGDISVSSGGNIDIQSASGITVTSGSVDFAAGTDLKMIGTTGNSSTITFTKSTSTTVGQVYSSATDFALHIDGNALSLNGGSVSITNGTATITIGASNTISVAATSTLGLSGSSVSITGSYVFNFSASGLVTTVSAPLGSSSVRWSTVYGTNLNLSGTATIGSSTISEASSFIITDSTAGILVRVGGSNKVVVDNAQIYPYTTKGMDNGISGNMWNNTYSATYYDDGGGYNDLEDDLALLHTMAPKQGKEGLLLDVKTIPDWMTNKNLIADQIKAENGDMVTDTDIAEWLNDDEQLGWMIRRNVGRFGDLTAGSVRQLDNKVEWLIDILVEKGLVVRLDDYKKYKPAARKQATNG